MDKEKVAILTTFGEFLPGYSLSGIVQDQAEMLSRHGHDVHLFVNEKYHGESFPAKITLRKEIPFAHLHDYRHRNELKTEHKMTVNAMRKLCVETLMQEFDIVFTHDFVFTGWNMPYALGIIEAAKADKDSKTRWLHWIHSVPSPMFDWWNIREYGTKHRLIYPNKTDALRVAEQYRGQLKDVRVIPHIKDLRSFFDFHEDTCMFIDEHPAVMQADIVQILPASVDRLEAKRVREVMLLFSRIKQKGFSICLVIANQWATGKQQKEDVEKYKKIARRNGLKTEQEVIFTSDFRPEYEVGIPKHMVRELFMCSNLLIFPTREESFGLAVPEAALASGAFLVLNKSLTMQIEISGFNALYFDFGSYHQDVVHQDEGAYFTDVATIILGRMTRNESLRSRTFMRQTYNWDALYEKKYSTVMKESVIW